MTASETAHAESRDWRHIDAGYEIPTVNYCDQPYVVQTDDNAWLCVVTTGVGHEGQRGQHLQTRRSLDQGQTWSEAVRPEPADGPEASYAVLLKTPGGRIYVFYNHNTDRIEEVQREDGQIYTRTDSLGHFVYKFSDDHGRTWSGKRYDIPVRPFACDRQNVYEGRICFFWNVGRPFVHGGAAYVPLHKVGAMGEGFFAQSEGVLLKSDNILTETDPAAIRWETLPDGDVGLRAPAGGGRIAEEQSCTVLSDGSFFSVYRTVDGHPACAYSRDQGHTWTPPAYMRYADGHLIKHPRAANFVWRCGNGKYLYWFHNHGGRFIREHPERTGRYAYLGRNPVWVAAGEEQDTPDGKVIAWSQPEILLFHEHPDERMSYPDLVEDQGRYYVTETQKTVARVHPIPLSFLERLWAQPSNHCVATEGLVLSLPEGAAIPAEIPAPTLPAFGHEAWGPTIPTGAGLSLDLWLHWPVQVSDTNLFDNRKPNGEGLCLQVAEDRGLELLLQDACTACSWRCDSGLLTDSPLQHVTVIVDSGPRLILFVVNGRLDDGGDVRQFGWGRFSPHLHGVQGNGRLRLGAALQQVRIYDRALLVSEAVGNWRAGCQMQ